MGLQDEQPLAGIRGLICEGVWEDIRVHSWTCEGVWEDIGVYC